MPDGADRVVADTIKALTLTPSPEPRVPPPLTRLELQMIRDREAFAAEAKYPLRVWAELTPEQLAATRAQLGTAAVVIRRSAPGALSAEHLAAARAAAGIGRPG